MKKVLISIQPKWVEKIAKGEKTIEVRKTRPKIETPFKVYIYCTIGNGMKGDYLVPSNIQCGKVIGEFTCDWVIGTCSWRLKGETGFCAKRTEKETNLPDMACLTLEDIERYAGSRGRGIYGWHISDLKIYDKPKELSEFRLPCTQKQCASWCKDMKVENAVCLNKGKRFITSPPQSWCYIEENENEI